VRGVREVHGENKKENSVISVGSVADFVASPPNE